jgi:hypothetical protein
MKPKSSSSSTRTWRVFVATTYITGVIFILEAIPLLFRGHGDWSTVLLHVAIAVIFGVGLVWILEPAIPRRPISSNTIQKPVLSALKVGLIVTGAMFVLGFVMSALSSATGGGFFVSVTLALAMGTWATLISYVSLKLTHKLGTSPD